MADGGAEAWVAQLDAWLLAFLAALPRAEQRRWAPLYEVALFRHALDEAGLPWALGILPSQKVFAPSVTALPQLSKRAGHPRKPPVPSEPSAAVSSVFADPPGAEFRTLSWRTGTRRPLRAAFAARRVRVADGPEAADGLHLPGEG